MQIRKHEFDLNPAAFLLQAMHNAHHHSISVLVCIVHTITKKAKREERNEYLLLCDDQLGAVCWLPIAFN